MCSSIDVSDAGVETKGDISTVSSQKLSRIDEEPQGGDISSDSDRLFAMRGRIKKSLRRHLSRVKMSPVILTGCLIYGGGLDVQKLVQLVLVIQKENIIKD